MSQPVGLESFGAAFGGGPQADLLSALAKFLKEVSEYNGGEGSEASKGHKGEKGGHCGKSDKGDKSDKSDDCGCSHGSDEKTVSGEFSIVGDPHVKGKLIVDGKEVSFDYTTEGGKGKEINLFDSDDLDITGKFDTLDRKDGNTYVTEETITAGDTEIEIDADDDKVLLNGREIGDGTYNCNGNKITKEGDKVTIETADGQKITIEDKGDYLDTNVMLDKLESGELGGMVGDAAKGKTNDNAEDYVSKDKGKDAPPEQGADWAVQLLKALGGMLAGTNPALGQFLNALASFIEQSQGDGSVAAAA